MNIWHDIDEERIYPTDFMAVIEITKGSNKKYELDKATPMTLVRCYPIGVIKMKDGGLGDEKIIAIPYGDPTYVGYTDISELPKHIFEEVQHFFATYKSLEGKETEVGEVGGAMEAVGCVEQCIENYVKKFVDHSKE